MKTLRGPLTCYATPIELDFQISKERSEFIDTLVKDGRSIEIDNIALKNLAIKIEIGYIKNKEEIVTVFVFLRNKKVIKKNIIVNDFFLGEKIYALDFDSFVKEYNDQIVKAIGFLTLKDKLAITHTLYQIDMDRQVNFSN